MSRSVRSLVTFFLALVLMLSLTCSAMADTVTVKGGYLRMRNSPSTDAVVLERYPSGTVLSLLGNLGDWLFVQASDGNKGYMMSAYLTIGAGSTVVSTSTASTSSGTAYVTSSNGKSVNLRARPNKNAVSITRYPVGTQVTILGTDGSWKKVKVGNNTGYMMTQFLSTAKVAPPASSSSSSASSSSSTTTAKVRSDNGKAVNMRSGPSKKNKVIGSYEVGTRATILKKGTVWSYISIGGQVGYMQTQYLR